MRATLRDFLKYTGAAGLAIASHDLVAELIAQSPKGNPLTTQFKGLSDIALGEAKKIGCSYADVRFTRSVSSGVNANGGLAWFTLEENVAAQGGTFNVTQGVPEPATVSMLGMGVVSLLGYGWRRRKQAAAA